MKKNDLSIIILNYNTKEFLLKCLRSLRLASSFDPELRTEGLTQGKLNVEVIVVDNHSTDGTVEKLKTQMSKLKTKTQNLKLIENNTNFGFSKGNNIGVEKAMGRYVLFLNPDTVLPKNVLKTVFEFMEGHPDVGVVSPKLVLADGSLDEASHRGFPTPWNAFCHFSGLRSLFPKSRFFAGYTMGWLLDENVPHEVESVGGAFFFVRRTAGEEVGWWDEDYFWYGEDLDFCYKVKERGWKVMFLPQVSVLHYRGVSSGIKGHSRKVSTATSETQLRAAHASAEAMRIFYKKHYVHKYPKIVTWFTLLAIGILERIRLWRVAI